VSKMAGIDLFFRNIFDLPVRIASPSEQSAMPQGRNSQEFSSVAGVVKYVTEKQQNPYRYIEKSYEFAKPKVKSNKTPKLDVKNVINKELKENVKGTVSDSLGKIGNLFKDLF